MKYESKNGEIGPVMVEHMTSRVLYEMMNVLVNSNHFVIFDNLCDNQLLQAMIHQRGRE